MAVKPRNKLDVSDTSSMFRMIAYDETAEVLYVEFKNSSLCYAYDGVPKLVWNEFLGAPSLGKYYSQSIKGQFPSANLGMGPLNDEHFDMGGDGADPAHAPTISASVMRRKLVYSDIASFYDALQDIPDDEN